MQKVPVNTVNNSNLFLPAHVYPSNFIQDAEFNHPTAFRALRL